MTQAPNGNLFDARVGDNAIYFHEPVEPATVDLVVKAVFPTRGSQLGGTVLDVYGVNLDNTTPTVTVGGNNCHVVSFSSSKIECTLPLGTGTVDVVVTAGAEVSTFSNGYRYITGLPQGTAAPTTPAPTISPAPTPIFPTTGTWIETDNNADIDARHEACFVMVGSKAYLIGGRGFKRTDIYDPVSRTWSAGAYAPVEPLHHMQCVAVDDKVYIVAAWTGEYPYEVPVDNVLVYDTTNNLWLEKTAMPIHRRRGTAAVVVVNRRIYVSHGTVGGHEQITGDLVRTVGWLDFYDVDTDTWTTETLPDAPHPRGHTGGALVNGNLICVSGGRDGGTWPWPVVLETDCFDVNTETWLTDLPDIPLGRAGSAYGTSCDGKLIVAGGEGGGDAWRNVDVFDGTSWSSLPDMVQPRHGTGLAVNCDCRQIYIASGAKDQGGGPELELSSIETYFFGGQDVPCTA